MCEICGLDQKADLFSAVTGEKVCAICKMKFIGGLPTTERGIQNARDRRGAEAALILGRTINRILYYLFSTNKEE